MYSVVIYNSQPDMLFKQALLSCCVCPCFVRVMLTVCVSCPPFVFYSELEDPSVTLTVGALCCFFI